jgi:molybdopterin-guanine dinucleotide biosynthesis protein MobB
VVGKSNSGKTTLVERLVAELAGQGYRVGTIKHSAKRFSMDAPGKDSYRHYEAGAVVSAVASTGQLGVVRRMDACTSLDWIIETFFKDVDIVIAEGYKSAPTPKIVIRPLDADAPLTGEIVAEIGTAPAGSTAPQFTTSDISTLADLIESRYLRPQSES